MFDHHRRHHHYISLIFAFDPGRGYVHSVGALFPGRLFFFSFLFEHIKVLEFLSFLFFFFFSDGFTPDALYCIFYFSFRENQTNTWA